MVTGTATLERRIDTEPVEHENASNIGTYASKSIRFAHPSYVDKFEDLMLAQPVFVGGAMKVVSVINFDTSVIDVQFSLDTLLVSRGARTYIQRSSSPLDLFLRKFRDLVSTLLQGRGITVISTDILHWQSTEDPSWKQWLFEVKVVAQSAEGFEIWDELGEMLHQQIDAEPESARKSLLDTVSVTVKWVSGNDV